MNSHGEDPPLTQPVLSPLANYNLIKPKETHLPGSTSRPTLTINCSASQWFGLSDFCGFGVKRVLGFPEQTWEQGQCRGT